MNSRKTLGFLVISLPFVVLFVGMAHVLGWLQAFGIFAIVAVITLTFQLGGWLIQSGRNTKAADQAGGSAQETASHRAACRFCGCDTSAIAAFPKRLAVTCSGCGATGPYAMLSEHGDNYQAATAAAWAYWNGSVTPGEQAMQ